LRKVLVANRGEIACRVLATIRRLGIGSVAVYSEADAQAMHVSLADEGVCIGPAPASQSYLNIPAIIEACRMTGAEAVHPGYGFLAENAEFADACEEAGIGFIGPSAANMRIMGSKGAALDLASSVGVPILPGYRGSDQSDEAFLQAADTIAYPVLIKPVAGGGGKGMHVVESTTELAQALTASRRESRAAFSDERLMLEKYLPHPRHVELQIFADMLGNTVHLFDRDCSIQRRHQKIIEEAPAPDLPPDLRAHMAETAIALARAIDYRGAGTVEFLIDGNTASDFYFMEMNTRLQVEHPVTEMILGVDLVEWQIRVARGEPLPAGHDVLEPSGHAIEARIYAEDPLRGFLPATGTLTRFRMPTEDAHTRVDTGVREGDTVGIHYDPMIAKVIVHGDDRHDAVQRLRGALDQCRIAGLPTNGSFLKQVTAAESFSKGAVDTRFTETLDVRADEQKDMLGLALACLYVLLERDGADGTILQSPWYTLPGWRLNTDGEDEVELAAGTDTLRVPVRYRASGYTLSLPSQEVQIRGRLLADARLEATIGDRRLAADVVRDGDTLDVLYLGNHLRVRCTPRDRSGERAEVVSGMLVAPMPGRVISVLVKRDAIVNKGQALMVIEAMKMEHTIRAPADGTVTAISFSEGELVDEGSELLTVRPLTTPTDC